MKPLLATVAAVIAASAIVIAADESVSTARELYAAAAYEDALLVLDRLRATAPGSEQARAIDQYRAFCLLALGRRADAEQAIAAVVTGEPSYHPSEAEVSPRLRATFVDVRRRVLPSIIQEKYAAAKAAFDRKDFVGAKGAFKQVLDLLNDPDLGAAAGQPPLSDVRMLATGFRELSVNAAPPVPLPLPSSPTSSLPIVAAPGKTGPIRGHIYGSEDADVVPPVTVRQVLPQFQLQTPTPQIPGVLELVVGEAGRVEAAVMKTSMHPKYDAMVIDAARSWRYQPATMGGVPVLYRKVVTITVKRPS